MNQEKKRKKPISRQQRRVSVTRQKLLNAARHVFAEKGMDLTTIDDITRRADVGKGTFYYHFKNKEGVIAALTREVLGELRGTIKEKCAGKTELGDVLDAMIVAHIEFFSARWEDFVFYFQGRADLKLEEGYSSIETPFIDYLEAIESEIASVISRRLPGPVLRRIGCAAAGFVSGYYSFASVASKDDDVDATFQSLRGALVASLTRFVLEELKQKGSKE